ncbi:unnamed protein product [Periconia digitata]|uniref:Uncharacterized protein n=1 Tax=Periconia digitata TaxID=1303443 RepID=A0A9W4UN94_9PLEO|nr:unnamed protein product [Periconia digitata]
MISLQISRYDSFRDHIYIHRSLLELSRRISKRSVKRNATATHRNLQGTLYANLSCVNAIDGYYSQSYRLPFSFDSEIPRLYTRQLCPTSVPDRHERVQAYDTDDIDCSSAICTNCRSIAWTRMRAAIKLSHENSSRTRSMKKRVRWGSVQVFHYDDQSILSSFSTT